MCYVLQDEKLIKIEEKTKIFKYEFLSSYIPMWNKILCGNKRRKRALIDSHAGTGKVKLNDKEIYGSSILFLEKTALKQELLQFYFIEKDYDKYHTLREIIDNVCEKGFYFPEVYGKKTTVIEKSGLPYEIKVPLYTSKVKRPNPDQIQILRGDCVSLIDNILEEIKDIPAFFFIDPCGKFAWELIEKIGENRFFDQQGNMKLNEQGRKIDGTELFINFSWEAILRNKNKDEKDKFFQEMYGLNWDGMREALKKVKSTKIKNREKFTEYDLYIEVYKEKLQKYFEYVIEMSIVGVKSEKNPIYAMIFCSNNEIAKNLYENKEVALNKTKKTYLYLKEKSLNKKEFTYEKYRAFMQNQKSLDEFFNKEIT